MDRFLKGWEQQITKSDRESYLKQALDNHVNTDSLSLILPRYDRILESLGADRALLKAIQHCRKQRELSLRECLRPRAGFIYSKQWQSLTIVDERDQCQELTSLLNNPDPFIEQGNIIKSGKATTVAIVTSGSKRFFVKRYNVKSSFYGLTRSLIPSRAAVTWHAAQLLESIGVPTARPVALLEKRWGGVKKESYVIHEYVESIHAMKFFAEGAEPKPEWQSVTEEIAAILYTLKRSLIIHGDLKAQNFIIHNNAPFLIDLDSLKSYQDIKMFNQKYSKDLCRFEKNWLEEPEPKALFAPVIESLKDEIS